MDLHDVTVCAADSLHPQLAARALEISMRQCRFADAILFSDKQVSTQARHIPISPLKSKGDYSAFILKELIQHVRTPWVLIVQWDGYVVDPLAWREEFLLYDYVGAPWPFHEGGFQVGNGGFSLRSMRLIQALADPRFELLPDVNEDDLICRLYRTELETAFSIRFAPVEIASRFACEYTDPQAPIFGFHGARNLWRHIDDDTMMDIALALDIRTFNSSEMRQLLMHYCHLGKFSCVRTMCERYLQHWSPQQLEEQLYATGVREHIARYSAEICARTMERA
ncbi:DUF5672 family protein [Caballeronia glebae]|uniref:DUF5672 family protein n=1 Tax=Caballeronia glebae TaxID=1777143 RepID=UPI0038BC2011